MGYRQVAGPKSGLKPEIRKIRMFLGRFVRKALIIMISG